MEQLLHIDGSLLEGGGQVLRNATALAAITRQAVQVDKIRAGRSKPGLSPQHLTGLQLVADITGGTLEGAAIRSSSIRFAPGPHPPAPGSFEADTKTAGSCTLMVQQSLPVLLFAAPDAAPDADSKGSSQASRSPKRLKGDSTHSSSAHSSSSVSHVTLRGGTDAAHAPPFGYLQHVFLPTLKRLVAPLCTDLQVEVLKRGFYPKGGGSVLLTVPALPSQTPLPPWQLIDRGHLVKVSGYAVTAGKLGPDVGQRMASSSRQVLREALSDPDVLFGAAWQTQLSSDIGPVSPETRSAAAPADVQPASAPAAAAAASSRAAFGPQQQQQRNRDPSSIPSVVLDIQAVHEPPERAVGDGGSVVLVAETSSGCLMGASALAERGVTAEAVGAMAARDLLEELRSGAAVDQWMQDQLIVFMALGSGSSSMLCGELTMHTRTAISIAQQLLPGVAFSVRSVGSSSSSAAGSGPALFVVECAGAGSGG